VWPGAPKLLSLLGSRTLVVSTQAAGRRATPSGTVPVVAKRHKVLCASGPGAGRRITRVVVMAKSEVIVSIGTREWAQVKT